MRRFPVRRDTLALVITLVILLVAWTGWLNWTARRRAAQSLASAGQDSGSTAPDGSIEESVAPLIGRPAPAFALRDLNGKIVRLADYRGKAVMLDFWATWCVACRIEMPSVVALRNAYAAQGFEVLGIDTEGEDPASSDKAGWAKARAAAAEAAAKEKVSYPVLLNGDSIADAYGGVDALPTSFFVNRKGVVVAAEVGMVPASEIASKIQLALQP